MTFWLRPPSACRRWIHCTTGSWCRPAVLLAHGQMDRRVPVVHAERLRDAMAAAGHAPEWVLYPDEGHGWLKPANRIDFAQRMERFLAEHLK